MGKTISEKILAKYAGKESVEPGEYVVLRDFVGPILYSFSGFNWIEDVHKKLKEVGTDKIAKPENCIINGDHNYPPKSTEDIELFKAVRSKSEELGIKNIYDKGEGIGHVVNVEKGHILPGKVFVHVDPQASNAGGIGAFYTNGGRLGSASYEAYALGEITIRVPETMRIEINGKLAPNISSRDIWFHILNDIGPDSAFGMVIEFAGTAIDEMSIEQRMVLCGNVMYAGADGAIMQADSKTQKWFKDNFNLEVETIKADEDAKYEKVLNFDAANISSMVTIPPEMHTVKPAKELGHIKVNQCLFGTCAGGTLDDLRTAARIVKGKKIHPDVRFLVSPVTRRVYQQAADEGLLTTLSEAGATILSSTCDVCIGVQGPLAPGEVGLSQQTLNTPGRSGSPDAQIYLASAATIAASALTGYITDPKNL